MPHDDQYNQHLLHTANSRRQHGSDHYFGTVHQVWEQQGEQKVRCLINGSGGGQPWLTPWLKVDSHHGSHKEESKWHKGQNVKVSATGADFRQCIVTSHGPNDAHPRPKYANSHHHTYQRGSYHWRRGPNHQDHFLTESQQGGQGGGGGGGGQQAAATLGSIGGGGGGGGGGSGQSDPYQDSIMVQRRGFKPQVQDQQGPWDGPDPDKSSDDNQSGPQHFLWAGKKGEVPDIGKDKVHHVQFGRKTKTRHTDGMKQSSVQSQGFSSRFEAGGGGGGASGGGVDQSATEHVMTADYNCNHVGQQSYHYISKNAIETNTGDHYIAATGSSWLHAGGAAHIHGSPILTNQMVLHGSHAPPSASFASVFHRLGHQGPLDQPIHLLDHHGMPLKTVLPLRDDAYPGDDYWANNGSWVSAATSSPVPPDGEGIPGGSGGPPAPGQKWHDSTTGIDYEFYNVWSEGGGRILFPASPTVGQLYPTTMSPAPIMLLHMAGVVGTKTFTDTQGHIVNVNGNVVIDNAQAQFGGTAALFDGLSYLSCDSSPAFALGTGDFTIDFWVYHSSLAAGVTQNYIDFRTLADGPYPCLQYQGATNILAYRVNNTNVIVSTAGAIASGQWYHIALARASGSTRLFLNGVRIGVVFADSNNYAVGGTDVATGVSRPVIGGGGLVTGGFPLFGWLQELRIIKGTAVWTANFTPPNQPYIRNQWKWNGVGWQKPAHLLTSDDGSTLQSDSPMSVSGAITVSGNSAVGGSITVSGNSAVGGSGTIAGSLTVTGAVNGQSFNGIVDGGTF